MGFVLPALVCAAKMWVLSPHTTDDAYISFRYARNLADGLGLVYNEGQRIEGYTNFLWTVLLALVDVVGLDPVVMAKVIGAAATVGTLWLVYRWSDEIAPGRRVPPVAPWLLATTGVFAGYGVFGLETLPFTFLVVAGSLQVWREERDDRPFPWSALLFAAAGLTRPEAPLYLGVWMLLLGGPALLPFIERGLAAESAGRSRDEGSAPLSSAKGAEGRRALVLSIALLVAAGIGLVFLRARAPSSVFRGGLGFVALTTVVLALAHLPRRLLSRRNLTRGLIFVAVVGAHLLWRKRYYGRWLPNTLGAKTGDIRAQIEGGTQYFARFVSHEGPILYAVVFGLAVAVVYRHRALLACAVLSGLGSIYVVLVGGDWMPLFRFMVPLLPFGYLLAGVAIRGALDRGDRAVRVGFAIVALITIGHRIDRAQRDRTRIIDREKAFWDDAAGRTADWFRAREGTRGRKANYGAIAVGDIGQIGYETNYPIFDVLGLVDPVISELPGGYTRKTGPGYTNHFFTEKPRYFVMISANRRCTSPSVPTSSALYRDRRFRPQYYPAGLVPLKDGKFAWCIFERRDAPGATPASPPLELQPL
ncbi:MAG: hypothetical protein AAGN82_03215 [Myxococcota bacterium]